LLATRIRISQNTSKISGRKLNKASMPVFLKKAGNSCGRARKMEAEAMNRAKHMRHRCRARRRVPVIPPRNSIRTSPMTAIRATPPKIKYGAGG